jgi:hypothetical protein
MTRINTAGVQIVHRIFGRLKELETTVLSITAVFSPMRLHFNVPKYIQPLVMGCEKCKHLHHNHASSIKRAH